MGQGEAEENSGQGDLQSNQQSQSEGSSNCVSGGCLGCLGLLVIAVVLIVIFAGGDDTSTGRIIKGRGDRPSGVSMPSAGQTTGSGSTSQRTSRRQYREPSSTGSSGSIVTVPPARRAPKGATGSAARGKYWAGKCTRVIDGDTIVVSRESTSSKVRLFGVDCPEKSQEHGTEATSFTKRWLGNGSCSVVPIEEDRYGRTVAWVYRGNRCLNLEIVRGGHGWWYREYAPKNAKLQRAQQQARAERRGLWADAHAVPPWRYRHSR